MVARIAARWLHTDKVAIVLGTTIHLWNTKAPEFLQNKKWLRHELVHVEQFKRYGFLRFIYLYVRETIKSGL